MISLNASCILCGVITLRRRVRDSRLLLSFQHYSLLFHLLTLAVVLVVVWCFVFFLQGCCVVTRV